MAGLDWSQYIRFMLDIRYKAHKVCNICLYSLLWNWRHYISIGLKVNCKKTEHMLLGDFKQG